MKICRKPWRISGKLKSPNCLSLISIEWDFAFPVRTNSLLLADSTRIYFLSDNNGNGAVDTVRYILSDINAASGTENPRDRILYRRVNTESQSDAALGVTDFKIRYFDVDGYESVDVSQIKTFEITLEVESTMGYDNQYARCYWQTMITPPNLMRM